MRAPGALRTLSSALVAALVAGHPAQAQATRDPAIGVSHAWARATVPGAANGAVYLTLTNRGGADDELVSLASPAAAAVQLHSESMDGGVMRMRPLAALDIKAGDHLVLAPGGDHVMLIGLKAPLRAGDHFPMTLTFAKAGSESVEVTVATAGAMAMPDPSPPGSGH